MTSRGPLSHDEIRDALAEHALGILDGRERAIVMTHVESCDECTSQFRALTATVDALAHVPMPADPPLGFESRVIERIHRSEAPTASATRRALRWAAAAALVVGAFGVGWAMQSASSTPPHSTSADRTIIQRGLVAGTRTVGSVWVDSGRTSWMFVSLDLPGSPRDIQCVLVTTSGRRELVGTYSLYGGHGAWGTTLPVPWSSVRTVEITSASGVRLAALSGPAWATSGQGVTN